MLNADPQDPKECIEELKQHRTFTQPRYPLERGWPFGLVYAFKADEERGTEAAFNCFVSATLQALYSCPNVIRNLRDSACDYHIECEVCSWNTLLNVSRAAWIHGMTVNPFVSDSSPRIPTTNWQPCGFTPNQDRYEYVHEGVRDLGVRFRSHMNDPDASEHDVGEFLLYLFFHKTECPDHQAEKTQGSMINFRCSVKYDCGCEAVEKATGIVNVHVSDENRGCNLIDILKSNEVSLIKEKNVKCGICRKKKTQSKSVYYGRRERTCSNTIILSLQGKTEQTVVFPFYIKYINQTTDDHQFEECKYELRSIVRHTDSEMKESKAKTDGHYTTIVKRDEKWYELNGPGPGKPWKAFNESLRVQKACYVFYDFVEKICTGSYEDLRCNECLWRPFSEVSQSPPKVPQVGSPRKTRQQAKSIIIKDDVEDNDKKVKNQKNHPAEEKAVDEEATEESEGETISAVPSYLQMLTAQGEVYF